MFPNEDEEAWVAQSEVIALYNGVKGQAALLAALGFLLFGILMTVYGLHLAGETGQACQMVSLELIA